MESIPISKTISIKETGFDEYWLQKQIWENPACLGLGDLESISREKVVSSGGKLAVLLKNPVDDSMYEAEIMLGKTDSSHIIRTIEYWDLIKRKWAQRQHFAVLVAERITKRFFNVIHILSNSVPLIAIQANIIDIDGRRSLHFLQKFWIFMKSLKMIPPFTKHMMKNTGKRNQHIHWKSLKSCLKSQKIYILMQNCH